MNRDTGTQDPGLFTAKNILAMSSGNTFLGFLTGAALGGIAGVIYTLEMGERTMRTAKTETISDDTGDEGTIQESISDLKESIAGFVEEVNQRFERMESRL